MVSLKSEVYNLLNNARLLCQECPGAEELLACLKEMEQRLKMPLRVAVVGIMKAGKSTFMNALMGSDILYTGNLETTYTVGWFQYADTPSLTVCFRDGEQMEAPFSDLAKWSVREYEKENSRIHDVKYLIIHYPSEVLKQIEFIDTPGLNSVYGTDAQNTLDFLSIKGSEDTLYEASAADAVIYAFSRTVAGFDREILNAFHAGGETASSPINSIGILTKADASGIWDIFEDITPVEAAKAVTANVMKNPEVKSLLFSVFPVCAKAAEGFARLNEEDWELLEELSGMDEDSRKELLYDAGQFVEGSGEGNAYPGTKEKREHLIDAEGQYGILEIAAGLREGKTKEEIQNRLREKSGVGAVCDILLSHFGNRAFLIKTKYILDRIRKVLFQIRKKSGASAQMVSVCAQVAEEIDNLTSSVQTLRELKALQMYYNGQLVFGDKGEEEDFLRVTGEYGRSAEERLGMESGCSVACLEQAAKAKVALWHEKEAGGFMRSGEYLEAASILARSYEQMYYHLNALCEE